jgi:hypothetical protein
MRPGLALAIFFTAVAGCVDNRTSTERFIDGEIRYERQQNIAKAHTEARAACDREVELLPGRTGEMASDYSCSYQARGDDWSLVIERVQIRLVETAGQLQFDYGGPLPPAEPITGGRRYQGQLTRVYAVGGLAEEDLRPYVLTILETPCTDRQGRVWPTTVGWIFNSEYRPTGCGGKLPI